MIRKSKRLAKVARAAKRKQEDDFFPPGSSLDDEPETSDDHEEFLKVYEENIPNVRDPDYPRLVAEYRAALDEARRSTDPPWDPPADYEPEVPAAQRVSDWRHSTSRFPILNELTQLVLKIGLRSLAYQGEPPYHVLAEWFKANEPRIRGLISSDGRSIDFGDGTSCSYGEIYDLIDIDFTGWHVGALIRNMAKLKAKIDAEDSRQSSPAPNVTR